MEYGAIAGDERPAARSVGAEGLREWVLLATLTLFTTGSHYFRHSVTGLGPSLMATLGVERLGFGVLFSLEQLPGVVLPALGGLFLLYLPLAGTAVALSVMLLASAVLCAAAVDARSFLGLAWGRALFGAAEGVMATLQPALIARAFRTGRVTTAFGVMLLVSRFSSFAGFALPPLLLEKSLSTAMWFGAAVLLIPLAATIVHLLLVKHGETGARASASTRPTASASATEVATIAAAAVRAVTRLRAPFWLISYMWATVACGVFTFAHFAPDAFSGVQGISTLAASLLSGTLFLVAGFTSPFIGALADRLGRRPAILITAAVCETAGLLLCAAGVVTRSSAVAVAGMALLTMCLCLAPVVMMACVAIIVPPQALPLALGAYKSVENLGLALVHVAVGALRDTSGDYLLPVLLLAVVALSAIPGIMFVARWAPETTRRAHAPGSKYAALVQAQAQVEGDV